MSHQHRTGSTVASFGYRGRALTLLGVVWILIGIEILFEPIEDAEHLLLVEQLPVPLRVGLWVAAGLVAVVTAWWPAGADRFGFMSLVVPATIRAISYAWSALLGLITDQHVGHRESWLAMLVWTVIVAFVLLLSSWPEPVRTRESQRPETA